MELYLNDQSKHKNLINDHIKTFTQNKNPLNKKGNEINELIYNIDNYETLDKLFNALLNNTSFRGEVTINSNLFDDNIGEKIASLIKNDYLIKLTIGNRSRPFSDRIARLLGDALEFNNNLKTLKIFLNVESLSPLHLCKFLKNPNSSLESFSYLKLNKNLFEFLAKYFNKQSKLNTIGFYYSPLYYIDLLYKDEIEPITYHQLADQIQSNSNITKINIIPDRDQFEKDINENMIKYIEQLSDTLNFSCEINKKELNEKIDIDTIYNVENKKMSLIM